MPKKRVVLAVHGGAGIILRSALTPELEADYRSALRDALSAGYEVLTKSGGDATKNNNSDENVAIEAVEAAVRCMEDCPLFNAGKGSVFANDEQIRCDASIMSCSSNNAQVVAKAGDDDGSSSDNTSKEEVQTSCHQIIHKRRYPKTPHPRAGAIAGVRNVQNPISLAKAVMERTPHVMLIGQGAEEFAQHLLKEARVAIQPEEYFWTERRWQQLMQARESERVEQTQTTQTQQKQQHVMKVQLDHSSTTCQYEGSDQLCDDKKFGTVGCIALYRPKSNDNTSSYQLASATSTGGMTNQRYHRVGDSPIIGAGTYANHLCAVSCTGHGEWFIRCVAAHDIAKRLEYKHGYDDRSCATDSTLLRKALEEVIFGTLISEGDDGEQGGDGGAIVLDKDGNFAADMNCPGMYHGWIFEDGEMKTSIFWDE